MKNTILDTASGLTDSHLLSRLEQLACHERSATAELVGHLAEVDRRRLYLGQGCGSMFAYCTSVLRLSESAAFKRIDVARAVRAFPAILDRLADGSLNLSTVRILSPHLTAENHASVLAQAAGMSKRQAEALVARLTPKPDVPSSIRKLPQPARTANDSAVVVLPESHAPRTQVAAPPAPLPVANAVAPPALLPPPVSAPATPKRRATVAPLSPERYKVEFTVDRETHDTLRQLQELLRREIPDGDPAAIVARALALLRADVERKKLAATQKRRPARPLKAGSRTIPADVKRAVDERDGGRCAFVADNGRRCAQRSYLEFHHCVPWALGGLPTVENISLRCRAHNGYEAELVFGPGQPWRVRELGVPYGAP